jgi:hypothetical protein
MLVSLGQIMERYGWRSCTAALVGFGLDSKAEFRFFMSFPEFL